MSLSTHSDVSSSSPVPDVTLTGRDERRTFDGPPEQFTGRVRIEMLLSPQPPARAAAARVVFEPAARTAWHTHPLGQTLIVTEGVGRVQCRGAAMREMRPGDVVWIPPGVKHWHGASPETAMTHIAINEQLDGKGVDWLEPVSDAEYAQVATGPAPGDAGEPAAPAGLAAGFPA